MVASLFLLRSTCRACDSPLLEPILTTAGVPLASLLLEDYELTRDEAVYPLTLVFCRACSLVQLLETVPPATLYGDRYSFYSSEAEHVLGHARDTAARLVSSYGLNSEMLGIEIGSNDGYLLRELLAHGVSVLGIEPAPGPAQVAREAGVPTLAAFFTRDLARYLWQENRRGDLIILSDVLESVPDLHRFLDGVRFLLNDDGSVLIETPYVRDLIEGCWFDAVHHERLSYFSVTSLKSLLESEGLFINDVEPLSQHGGSLRLRAGRHPAQSDAVDAYLHAEETRGVNRLAYYQDFAARAAEASERLDALLGELKSGGKRIVGYGAGPEASALLNRSDLAGGALDYVVDASRHRQGRFIPGVHLRVRDMERLLLDQPDYALLLDPSFKEEVVGRQVAYRRQGGRFIVPLPDPSVI